MRHAAILALMLAGVPLWAQKYVSNAEELERELKRIMRIYALLERESASEIDPDQAFFKGAIPGMLRKLDPHTVFFDKEQYDQLKEMEKAVSKGFGTVVSVMPGRVIVLQTLAGAPAQRAGLQPGDEIVGINNIPLARLDMDQLVGLLSQARTQPVMLYVRRAGTSALMPFTMTPEEMQSPSVDRVYKLEYGIGFIRVNGFEAKTSLEIQQAIEKLGGERLKGLVLDLRDNPGGVLDTALQTAALFLKPGMKILSASGRSAPDKPVVVPDGASPYEFPLVVLINGKSASGSEIVAGALQDHDRATVLGEPSFGKGLVQSVFSLSEGTGLALTTAFYYTPSGRSIQKPLRGGQLDEATQVVKRPEYRTDSGRVVRGGGGIDPDEVIYPPQLSRLDYVLEMSASFSAFATEYLRPRRSTITAEFEVTPAVLDDFQLFLSQRNIRPGVADWTAERAWISSRLKQEIFNQSIGVVAGDEIELKRDPVVKRALAILANTAK